MFITHFTIWPESVNDPTQNRIICDAAATYAINWFTVS